MAVTALAIVLDTIDTQLLANAVPALMKRLLSDHRKLNCDRDRKWARRVLAWRSAIGIAGGGPMLGHPLIADDAEVTPTAAAA